MWALAAKRAWHNLHCSHYSTFLDVARREHLATPDPAGRSLWMAVEGVDGDDDDDDCDDGAAAASMAVAVVAATWHIVALPHMPAAYHSHLQ